MISIKSTLASEIPGAARRGSGNDSVICLRRVSITELPPNGILPVSRWYNVVPRA